MRRSIFHFRSIINEINSAHKEDGVSFSMLFLCASRKTHRQTVSASAINLLHQKRKKRTLVETLLEAIKLYVRANKLYKAALLSRCYVQHFLSPYSNSEVNHKRHLIKIPVIYKGMEFIYLHSIFKDNSVISSIPNYFNNSETPIICYKYYKPIRSTIFNFNKIATDIDIGSNTPDS